MHAVTRTYVGHGAMELCDLLEARKAEVEKVMRSVAGFHSYLFFRTEYGGISVTVCKDKAGSDQTTLVAHDWVAKNAGALDVKEPVVSDGAVVLQFS